VLAQFCERVHLVHRGERFRAKPHLVDAVQSAGNITVHFRRQVSEVLGHEGVEGVRLDGETLACTGFFAFVGLEPNSAFLPARVARDARGAVITSARFETGMPGVYAAGAVRSGCGGMIEDAIAEGEAAAAAVAARLALTAA
jgi:thioredoxin reductase (NADPH)